MPNQARQTLDEQEEAQRDHDLNQHGHPLDAPHEKGLRRGANDQRPRHGAQPCREEREPGDGQRGPQDERDHGGHGPRGEVNNARRLEDEHQAERRERVDGAEAQPTDDELAELDHGDNTPGGLSREARPTPLWAYALRPYRVTATSCPCSALTINMCCAPLWLVGL